MYIKKKCKKKCAVLICVLLLALAAGCSKEGTENADVVYEFPVEEDIVEKVLLDHQLNWSIEDEQSFAEGHLIFSYLDEDDVFCNVSTYGAEGRRELGINFHLPQKFTSEQIEKFNETQWLRAFEAAGDLYGNSEDTRKAYKSFLSYVDGRDSAKYKNGYFTKRIDDTHYKAKLSQFENDKDFYQLYSIEIISHDTYEKKSSASAEGYKRFAKSEGVKVLEGISVSEIAELDTEDEQTRLIVKGHLEKVRRLRKMPEELSSLTDKYSQPPHKDDFFTAKLIDDTGSDDVYVISTSLTAEELGSDRNHHIDYFSEDKVSVIILSPLNE